MKIAAALLLALATLAAAPPTARTLAYGTDPAQTLDVYAPAHATKAPLILMVHGGGWRRGDKDSSTVVENKLHHWGAQGFVFVSINYRMLPEAPVSVQAADVARAFSFVQREAQKWGADPSKIILMGHSAGAHLSALVVSDGRVKPWGTVLLDSAALDVPKIMNARHFPLYDQAFGSDPATWRADSPIHALHAPTAPILAVCSSRRLTSCEQADAFTARAKSFGTRASVLRENLSHREINETLGEASPYTAAVDAFIRSLR